MTYIKRLVMHGFKSFARKTELPFTEGINVILGPNGSGKSNVSDALCFVLGRLSIKSMRAAKSQNLIFLGTKNISPAKEASVEIIFDNSDKTFSIEKNEISIKRIVRKNGQGIYKINDETKTRQEILSLLAEAGIDPNGFNIILQGEIQNFVRMHTEERRKIIEEVSGISIYESRKEKSMKELEKTEDRLKEVYSILRERTSYLNNLEKEREQALKFKKLEQDAKKFQASIIYQDLNRKKKENENLSSEITKKIKESAEIKKIISNTRIDIENCHSKINSINSTIEKSTGLEQEKLNQEIANIRAELSGLNVKLENYEKKLSEISKQKQEFQEAIKNNEGSINELHKETPSTAKTKKDVEKKKGEMENLEEQRKKFYMIKSELKTIKDRIEDKKSIFNNYSNESEFLLKQINSLSRDLFDKETNEKKLNELKKSLSEKRAIFEELEKKEKTFEKSAYSSEYEIEKQNKLKEKISGMDICPLCKTKMTKEHIEMINKDALHKIKFLEKETEESDKRLKEISRQREIIKQDILQIESETAKRASDLVLMSNIDEKKEQIKVWHDKTENLKKEILEMEKKKKFLESKFEEFSNIEQKYETARMEVAEISARNKETIGQEISFKQMELERSKISLKQLSRNEEDLKEEFKEMRKIFDDKEKLLAKKREQETELSKKFEKMISEKNKIETEIRKNESEVFVRQNKLSNVEQEMNNLKIDKARIDAETENLENDFSQYDKEIEIIKTSRENLVEKLGKTKDFLLKIGSFVNLRSLEVYDSVKKEYDEVKEKAEIIGKEKESILKIIQEIDVKKKKTFFKTLNALNEIFSRNFSQLSTKGQVYLELENKQEPFEAGVGIVVKTGHGKYLDVTSLSGGEQTIVALSLIFAIQELSPYCFYMLDEIDAALDKRNSERLAELLKKYMQKGQYIVITHNDEVITNATNLYGVSMHEGISKIISLRV